MPNALRSPPVTTAHRRVQRGYKVRALGRSADKVKAMFGGAAGLEVVYGDMRAADTLPAALSGVQAVCCCTGTTAFPSARCAARRQAGLV